MSFDWRAVLSACAPLALLAACPGEIDDPTPFLTTSGTGGAACFDVETELFPERCIDAGCHNANDKGGNLDLESPDAVARLVGVAATSACGSAPLVDPFDPPASVLYLKLTPDYCSAAQMPLGGDALTDAELACVLAWIEAQSGGPASSSSTGGSGGAGGTEGAGGSAGAGG